MATQDVSYGLSALHRAALESWTSSDAWYLPSSSSEGSRIQWSNRTTSEWVDEAADHIADSVTYEWKNFKRSIGYIPKEAEPGGFKIGRDKLGKFTFEVK